MKNQLNAAAQQASGRKKPGDISIGVVGIGGGGSNSVINTYDSLYQLGLNLEYFVINTDEQALFQAGKRRIQKVVIGEQITQGMGAGANPLMGYKAMKESADKLEPIYEGKDIIFVVAGFGGGTGSGAAPFIIEEAKKRGILTIVFGTFPWQFEGKKREDNARISLNSMYNIADSIIVINNDFLNDNYADKDASLLIDELFKKTDTFLKYAILTISTLILERSVINIDLNDIRAALRNSNFGFFFICEDNLANAKQSAQEEGIVEEHAELLYQSLKSTFVKGLNLSNTKTVVVNVAGNKESISMPVVNKVFEKIKKDAPKVDVLFGLSFNPYMQPGDIQLSGLFADVGYEQANISTGIDSEVTLQNINAVNEGKMRSQQTAEENLK